MKGIILFVLSVLVFTFFINYSTTSAQIRSEATSDEKLINNAITSFLDKVSDSGVISAKDYTALQTQLMNTGGAFSISITVTRLYPVPDPNISGNYVMDYKPAYGWSSDQGGLSPNYVDPNWQTASYGDPPKGVQYLVKADNVALVVKQTDAMPYQRTMVARLSTSSNLGTWSGSKAVRDSGNLVVGSQTEPMQ